MTEQLKKGQRVYPGLGVSLPTDKVDRQQALVEQLKRQDNKDQALFNKLGKRYDDREKNLTEAERRQGDQV